jgi:7-carboxy-7-deazaguanine synthase
VKVCEVFKSIQGESTFAGTVCSFVRLTGCNLRCTYCDTTYAWTEGSERSIDSLCAEVTAHRCAHVEITGGEPLLQEETPELCRRFLEIGKTVLVETNGSLDISRLPAGAIRIMDVKCPSSGMAERFLSSNVAALKPGDECKFVISNNADYDWSVAFVRRHHLTDLCTVIFSPNTRSLPMPVLAGWIVAGDLPVRLGLQLHKVIWGENARGV